LKDNKRKYFYLENRYLQFAKIDEIEERLCDVVSNIGRVSPEIMFSPLKDKDESSMFISLLVDVLVEMELRYGLYPKGFDNFNIKDKLHLPDFEYDIPEHAKLYSNKNGEKKITSMFKFGKKEYLAHFITEGELYFTPAAKFDNEALPKAVRDSELRMDWKLGKATTSIHNPKENKGEIIPVGDISVSKEVPHNYWINCFSARHELRMYSDFKADQCIEITNTSAFISRVQGAFSKNFKDRGLAFGGVHYLDPYLDNGDNLSILFTKPLRYFYQGEIRLVVVPKDDVRDLEPFKLNIGNLEDIASFIVQD
jgi:hypothetical protein